MDINQLHDILLNAKKLGATDVHFVVGSPPVMHLDNDFVAISQAPLTTVSIADALSRALLGEADIALLAQEKEIIRAYTFSDNLRCRFRISFQKAVPSLSFHVLSENIPTVQSLRLPETLNRFIKAEHGLLIVSGPYGSGRSSTATAIIQEINKQRSVRILTIESPVEYILTSQRALVEQREVPRDVISYDEALREVSNEDIGVLYLDRIDDVKLIHRLLELASSRLVIVVVEAPTSLRAIERVLSAAPSKELGPIRNSLADNMLGVICQRLVPRVNGGMVVIIEIMLNTAPIKATIREGKLSQITNIIQTSKGEDMIMIDQALAEAVKNNEISQEEAIRQSVDEEYLKGLLERI